MTICDSKNVFYFACFQEQPHLDEPECDVAEPFDQMPPLTPKLEPGVSNMSLDPPLTPHHSCAIVLAPPCVLKPKNEPMSSHADFGNTPQEQLSSTPQLLQGSCPISLHQMQLQVTPLLPDGSCAGSLKQELCSFSIKQEEGASTSNLDAHQLAPVTNDFEAFARDITAQLQKMPLEVAMELQQQIQTMITHRLQLLKDANDSHL